VSCWLLLCCDVETVVDLVLLRDMLVCSRSHYLMVTVLASWYAAAVEHQWETVVGVGGWQLLCLQATAPHNHFTALC
jgi:hypothetical protein